MKLRLLTAALCLAAAPITWADNFPSKPITIVVPVGAGGFQDTTTRIFAKYLATELGQPVVIENQPSAGSIVGTRHVAKAKPDGYTLLAITDSFTITPRLLKEAGYETREFTGVGPMVKSSFVTVVGAKSEIRTLPDLVQLARKRPHQVSFASSGSGALPHLAVEMFAAEARLDLLHVPYRGVAPSIPDVISGRIDFTFNPVGVSLPQIRANQMRALAVSSARRSPLLPEVPTLAESGYPQLDITFFAALVAPAKTPRPVIERLAAALNAVKSSPELIASIQQQGDEVAPAGSAEQFNALLKDEEARYARLLQDRGIQTVSP